MDTVFRNMVAALPRTPAGGMDGARAIVRRFTGVNIRIESDGAEQIGADTDQTAGAGLERMEL